MKKSLLPVLVALVLGSFMLTGCEAIGSIFKAGVWSGIIIVFVVIALIVYFFSRGSKK